MNQATTTLQNQTNMHDDSTHDFGGQAVTGLGLGSSSSQVDFNAKKESNRSSDYWDRYTDKQKELANAQKESNSSSDYWQRYTDKQKELAETDPIITDKKPTPETVPDKKVDSHGDLAKDLYNYNSHLEYLDSLKGKNMTYASINDALKYFQDNKLISQDSIDSFGKSIKDNSIQNIGKLYESLLNEARSTVEQKINDIRTNENYDPRGDEQIREDDIRSELQDLEDTKYQREVDDMTKAGLNKALMFGVGGSGGGVASGSNKAESEEERRRRKKREERELALKQQAEERAKTQQMINLIMGIAGAGSMAGLGLSNVAVNKANIAERARQFDAQSANRDARRFRDDSQAQYTREKWYSMLDKKGNKLW